MKKIFDYAKAGVNIDIADAAKRKIKSLVKATFTPGVLSEIGKFGGFFSLEHLKYKNPVFVSSVDGVGTKLKVASMMHKFDTVGIDLVNHCADDILVHGARPIFFLDYIAMAKTTPEVVGEVVKGMVTACKLEKCALIGGETAQMPDVYKGNDFDLVGLVVGIVEKSKIIDGKDIKAGDKIIGLKSTGLHTNGYTLARKLFFGKAGYKAGSYVKQLKTTVGKALLAPHRSYTKPVFKLIDKIKVNGLAHITGGGFTDNIPRILPEGVGVVIEKKSWQPLPVFEMIAALGKLEDNEMYRTFNMGIGMCIFVAPKDLKKAMKILNASGEKPVIIGDVVKARNGTKKVEIV